MIFNWIDIIKKVCINNSNEKDIQVLEAEFNNLLDELQERKPVVIVVKEGIRIEISLYYEEKELTIKDISKDFNVIFNYNQLSQQVKDQENIIKEEIKDNPKFLETFNEYLEAMRELSYYKFRVDFVETKNGNSKVFKTTKDLTFGSLKAYLIGMLNAMGIYFISKELNYDMCDTILLQSFN